MHSILFGLLCCLRIRSTASWTSDFSGPRSLRYASTLKVWSSTTSDYAVEIVETQGDEACLKQTASFLIDSFWLGSPHHFVPSGPVDVDASTKARLSKDQFSDLTAKYGELIGARQLKSCLLAARDTRNSKLLGVVGMQVSLKQRSDHVILDSEEAESRVKNAVAGLGPKQRRAFKNTSLQDTVTELLPELETVCCLSNLAVLPSARGNGIASSLCLQVEEIARRWEFNSLCLKVECANESALKLYGAKLDYEHLALVKDATAVRIDFSTGSFVEVPTEILIMTKQL